MSFKSSPIRGLQPNIKEFTIENYSLNTENERLTQTIIAKNKELQSLIESNTKLKNTYEAQANAYRKTIDSLERQLNQNEAGRQEELKNIQQKYSKLSQEEVENLKNSHTNQIEFLFKEIAQMRASIETFNSKIELKQHELSTLKASYERELQMNTSQINTLNKKIIQLEDDRLKEIKDLNNKRELQKSRTSGMVTSRKETNQYIEKQLRKLNEQVLEKTIGIENITRQLAKEKKKHEESVKTLNKKIEGLTEDYEHQLKEKDQHFIKIQKILKDQLLEYKEKEIKLLNENQSLTSKIKLMKKQIQSKEAVTKAKTEQIASLKASIEQIREEHITQINNLMKERRKRSSKSNLGSSRSLSSSIKDMKDMKDSNLTPNAAQPSPPFPQPEQTYQGKFLPTVKEQSPQKHNISQEFDHSNILGEQQNENELARAILHYDTIILELKQTQQTELEYFKLELEKVTNRLKEKQLQIQDVLTRFSPLVKIHADEKSLEQDRKERMDRHWKADLSILEVMLHKYKIRTF